MELPPSHVGAAMPEALTTRTQQPCDPGHSAMQQLMPMLIN